ncbi:MAG TPA: molybdopterin-dependent oxidoreductase, partial [Nocardioides sp.]|nr:molybdopterin-dependent oxidoreductase [Nocardioides sp.]
MSSSRTGPVVVAGAVAGLAGVAVSQVLTVVLGVRVSPVLAVAEAVVELTPGPVAEVLISIVGTWDKPLLVGGVVLGVVALVSLAGVLARRSVALANTLLLVMAVVALGALVLRPGFSSVSVVPLAAGVATWMVVLALLSDRAERAYAGPGPRPDAGAELGPQVDTAQPSPGASRRSFLALAGAAAVVSVAGVAAAQLLSRGRRAVETSRRLLRLPAGRGVVPDGAELELPGLSPWRVPNEDFYRIDTALVVPAVDPSDWRLRIHGMVEREIVVTYADLLERERTEAWVTLCCVSNEVGGDLIGNAYWSGVRVADLLAEAGVDPDADAVRQTSEDGWNCGTPLTALTDGRDALLAVAMNGEPLPLEHGFPVRMVVPGLYGFVSATKWLVDLEVTRFDRFTAYWTERGWSAQGPVKTQSRIEVPGNGDDVPAGRVRVGGHAWAQHTGVEKVEVRVDGNAWTPAELGRVPSDDTWVQWAATV